MISSFQDKFKSNSFLLLVLLLCIYVIRISDLLINSQLHSDDSEIFFKDAYELGIKSLLYVFPDYAILVPRLIIYLATFFPLDVIPYICGLATAVLQFLPVFLILSRRTDEFLPSYRDKYVLSLIYILIPNCDETFVMLTNLHWYLPFHLLLFLFAKPHTSAVIRRIELAYMIVICFTGPLPIVIFFVALPFIRKYYKERKFDYVMILCSCIIQIVIIYLFAGSSKQEPLNLLKFIKLFSSEFILRSVFGLKGMSMLSFLVKPGVLIASLILFVFTLFRTFKNENNFVRVMVILTPVIAIIGIARYIDRFNENAFNYWGSRYFTLPVLFLIYFYFRNFITSYNFLLKFGYLSILAAVMFIAIPMDFKFTRGQGFFWHKEIARYHLTGKNEKFDFKLNSKNYIDFSIIKTSAADSTINKLTAFLYMKEPKKRDDNYSFTPTGIIKVEDSIPVQIDKPFLTDNFGISINTFITPFSDVLSGDAQVYLLLVHPEITYTYPLISRFDKTRIYLFDYLNIKSCNPGDYKVMLLFTDKSRNFVSDTNLSLTKTM